MTSVTLSRPEPPTSPSATPFPTGRARLTSSDRFVYLLAIPVFLIIAFFVVIPMLSTGFASGGGAGLGANYTSFFSGSSRTALVLSIGISIASVVLCGIIGTLMAVLLNRFQFPGRRALEVVAVLPMALPPLIGAVSFVFLFSETGIIPRFLQQSLGIPASATAVTGIAGVLLVHAFTMYPFFYLSVAAGLAGLDSSLEQAAANLGASRYKVWVTVILPMLTPALVSGALLTFMISMASFTAPQLYNVQTLTMQIVSTRTGGNDALAAAQSTVLAIVSILFLIGMRWYQGRRIHRSVSKGVQRDRVAATGLMSYIALFGSVVLSLILLAPIAVIFLVSFSVDSSWTTQVLPDQYTWSNYRTIFTDPASLLPINVSVQTAFIATLVAIVIGGAAAWIIARWPGRRGKTLLDIAIMLPWALPGTVIGINLVTAFNEPSPTNLGLVLVGSILILPVAYFVRYVPLIFRSTGASLDQIDPSLEQAARSLGAGSFRTLRTVTMPLVAKGILAGALLAFVDGVGEYVASVIIYPAGYPPMSVAIYDRIYSAEFGSAAAYGSLQIVLIFVVLVISNRLQVTRRRKRRSAPTEQTKITTTPLS